MIKFVLYIVFYGLHLRSYNIFPVGIVSYMKEA